MTRLRGCWLLFAVLFLPPAPTHAQFVPQPFGMGYGYSNGISYTRIRKNSVLRVGFGNVGFVGPVAPAFWGPPLYTPGFLGYPTFVPRVTVVNIISPPPPPPVVVLAPRIFGGSGEFLPRYDLDDLPEVPDDRVAPRPMPPVKVIPRPIPKEKPKEKEVKPPPRPKPKPEPKLPRPPEPDEDPAVESARQLKLGEDAFREGAYGLAAHRFQQASKLRPKLARPWFLLAQAYLALNKYHLAAKAIAEGMDLQPNWPASDFRPLGMYDDVTEYSDHLGTLRRALDRFPDDPVLLLLTGYVLWFDGRQDDAAASFRKAQAQGADAGVVERFLAALPDRDEL